MLSIFHLFNLSYCCLDRPCRSVGYQHFLIFSLPSPTAWPAPKRRLWPMLITPRHPTPIYDRLLQFHFDTFDRPPPSCPWFLSPSAFDPGLSHTLDSSRRFSFITDCQPRRCATTSVRIRQQTIQTLHLNPVTPLNRLPTPVARLDIQNRVMLSHPLPVVPSGQPSSIPSLC